MGGMCDEEITAGSKDEMLAKGMEHVEAAHPEMAESIKKMSPADPLMVDWQKKFDASYEAAPEK
ncbi:MAG: hypothetical protein JWN89_257 [Parcubacteria group bacterium]|nr:hypothetical protein [Parcubacteria group bacterium]